MNPRILNNEVQDFISKNLNTDIYRLLLQDSPFHGVTNRELAEQIEARRKAEEKLPSWIGLQMNYFPNKKNLEQSSSEITARYKAGIKRVKCVLDLTGGFGVDSYFFSKTAEVVHYCETDENIAQIAAFNFTQLGALNISVHHGDGIQWLQNTRQKGDLIYLDPSRRDQGNKRVFRLAHCQPNVTEHLDSLFRAAEYLMIKTSPLLDLRAGLTELPGTREIHVVAVNSEVKEVLWLLKRGYASTVSVKAINIKKHQQQLFSFSFEDESSAASDFSDPLAYLYEPNSAIMKSGGFKVLGEQFHLAKLDEHSHLYTSLQVLPFPGRVFRIIRVLPYSKKNAEKLVKKANVSCRNFPLSVSQIRKRHGIADGGEIYYFFTRAASMGPIVIECKKI